MVKVAKLATFTELVREKKLAIQDFVEEFIKFYHFDRKKLNRMDEDGEESGDVSSQSDSDNEFYY